MSSWTHTHISTTKQNPLLFTIMPCCLSESRKKKFPNLSSLKPLPPLSKIASVLRTTSEQYLLAHLLSSQPSSDSCVAFASKIHRSSRDIIPKKIWNWFSSQVNLNPLSLSYVQKWAIIIITNYSFEAEETFAGYLKILKRSSGDSVQIEIWEALVHLDLSPHFTWGKWDPR